MTTTKEKKVLAVLNDKDHKIIAAYLAKAYPDKKFSKPEILSFCSREIAKRIENGTI